MAAGQLLKLSLRKMKVSVPVVALLFALLHAVVSLRVSVTMKISLPDRLQQISNSLKNNFQPKAIAAVLCSALIVGNPGDAFAARSGSRSGGSSFRSSTRGYSGGSSGTRLNSYSSTYRSTTIIPMPMLSPFSYGYGFSPFGIMPVNADVVLLAGAAYLAYTLLKNRAGGSSFLSAGEGGSLGSGATVIKLQIALESDWSQEGNIMETMSRISQKNAGGQAVMTGRTELSTLLSETALALLRRKDSWSAASLSGERFAGGDGALRAEPSFQRTVVQERSKFESEVKPSASDFTSYSDFGSNRAPSVDGRYSGTGSKQTQAVVSVVVAMRGRSEALRGADNVAVSVPEVTRVLQTLASEALSDEGENVLGVEVLWTPSERGRTLTPREMLLDYPELLGL
jgi:uncharacterized membrane protein